MALKVKQKKYIDQHYRKQSVSKMARTLKVSEEEISDYLDSRKPEKELDAKKKVVFTLIMLLIPLFFFVAAEGMLRLAGFGKTEPLFIFPERHQGKYGQLNPDYHLKFFSQTSTFTAGRGNVFLSEKPENGFRVFVLGASTTESYPYAFNGVFSLALQDMLRDVLPEKHVEVVNLGITATNTYTLYDMYRELKEQQPDALLIYSGQNEYYGAMGVASSERIATFPGLVRFYLRVQRLALFQGIQQLIQKAGTLTGGGASQERDGMLMERMVRENMIPLDSRLYRAGKRQYKSNLSNLLKNWQSEGVPVFIASLASNLKDHAPFHSVETEDHPAAQSVYDDAKALYQQGRYEEALEHFRYARDLDALRFRAPSAFKDIIKDKAEEYGAVYVPYKERMLEKARNGIIGFDLMLEHLHPNSEGYALLAEAFFDAMAESLLPELQADLSRLQDGNIYRAQMFLTEFDHAIAEHRVRVMKNSWPFVNEPDPRGYPFVFEPTGRVDQLAHEYVMEKFEWHEAKIHMANHFMEENQYQKALDEVHGLLRVVPYERDPWILAADMAEHAGRVSEALFYLRQALEIRAEASLLTRIGQKEATRGNPEVGAIYFERAYRMNTSDVTSLYRAAVAYGAAEDFSKAIQLTEELERVAPDYPNLQRWKQHLQQVAEQRQAKLD
ncbi:hypothetical protein QLX67_10310 [Balneolaceae bacterium ANBcel3]|nr:hypothetical protein [Balneolaceae bacterium ANBcel3]